MAGRLYRMAKVVSANPKSWGIVDANEISGFKRVAKLSDLYSIAECILSSSYGDGVTDGADAVGQIWHVSETNGDYKLTNWASRKSAAGWTKLSYGGDVSVPVRDVHVNNLSVLSNGVAKIDLTPYAKTTTTDTLTNNVNGLHRELNNTNATVGALSGKVSTLESNIKNIDTTVYEVIGNEDLPTTGIKKRIYLKLIETGNPTGDNNKYAEYVYTGDPSVTYDATKWEKLGEVAAKTDLSEYYKKTEINTKVNTLNGADIQSITFKGVNEESADLTISLKGGTSFGLANTTKMFCANSRYAGLMSSVDKGKLDRLNNYTHPKRKPEASGDDGLYKITVDDLGHVSKTTAVTKEDITKLGIPGSAPTVDAAMSETSTNAVQNKVIDNAIKTHIIDNNNLDAIDWTEGDEFHILGQNSENYKVSSLYESLTYHYSTSGGYLTIDGSTVWNDSNLTALTDTELNNILK